MITHTPKDWFVDALVTAVGGTVAGVLTWSAFEGWAAKRWPVARAEITSSEIEVGHTRFGPVYEPTVTYTYALGGASYKGDRFRFDDVAYHFRSSAQARLAPYPVGTAVQVRYHPDHPARAVLEPGVEFRTLLRVSFFTALFCLGAGLLVGIVH